MSSTRVLQVCGCLSMGGLETVVRDTCEVLHSIGHDVDVCLVSDGFDRLALGAELLRMGCRIHTCRLGAPPCGFAKRFGAIQAAGHNRAASGL